MREFAFYDAKPYDKVWFDEFKKQHNIELRYIENRLCVDTAGMAHGCDGVIAFVNDTIDSKTINTLHELKVKLIAMRCSGYNNVDLKSALGKIKVVRVPSYSPYAVAEYAMALLFALNRKIHRAYIRTKDFDFSIDGLSGFDLHGKTAGVIGTGKIGKVFINICKGIGMNVVAYDPYPTNDSDIHYKTLEELFKQSDIISLHCPLTKESKYIIESAAIEKMKSRTIIINTSRGELIDTSALLNALKTGKIGGAGLDVYEEEADVFYEDFSDTTERDEMLTQLLALPNVIVTSHQAFLTDEALKNIARITFENIDSFYKGNIINEIKA